MTLLILVIGVLISLVWHCTEEDGQRMESIRTVAGLLAILVSDAAIVFALIWGASRITGSDKSTVLVGLATAAFTAVSTVTTAYLGIKAVSNTAQLLARKNDANPPPPPAGPPGGGKNKDGKDGPGGPPESTSMTNEEWESIKKEMEGRGVDHSRIKDIEDSMRLR
ncbi:hypothetical protein [Streptomyces thioluteus]|uniref:hypothetical protein n=1 Tax=Streptomyces thioluteus TaxID=66431 RepID=UPI0031E8F257